LQGEQGAPTDVEAAPAEVVSPLEEHGIVGGITRQAFTPGLMTGLAGAIHALNRMHPDCDLASPLLLECRRKTAAKVRGTEMDTDALAIS
jgi:hypothetical protein